MPDSIVADPFAQGLVVPTNIQEANMQMQVTSDCPYCYQVTNNEDPSVNNWYVEAVQVIIPPENTAGLIVGSPDGWAYSVGSLDNGARVVSWSVLQDANGNPIYDYAIPPGGSLNGFSLASPDELSVGSGDFSLHSVDPTVDLTQVQTLADTEGIGALVTGTIPVPSNVAP